MSQTAIAETSTIAATVGGDRTEEVLDINNALHNQLFEDLQQKLGQIGCELTTDDIRQELMVRVLGTE